jgi:hypothetical protein
MRKLMTFCTIALAALPAIAMAQATDTTGATSTGRVTIVGHVARLCVLGPPSTAVVDLGEILATSGADAGKVAQITTPPITLPGSFCNFANASVTVDASALVAADGVAVLPGFARLVNFTGTASGWTITPTSFDTATAPALARPQPRPTPFNGDITLGVGGFSVAGGPRLVADTAYLGTIKVTVAAVH